MATTTSSQEMPGQPTQLGQTRRSETVEQEQYEKQIHDQQKWHVGKGSDHSQSTDDLEQNFDKMGVSDHKPEDAVSKPGMRGKIKGMFKDAFPEAIQDTKIMMGMTALEARVKKEMHDPSIFPEVEKVATVRRGLELCEEEKAFLAKRKVRAKDNFAKYLGLKSEDVDPRDVPTVSFGGSGGGFRAMIGCLGYCRQMQHAGLWDCLTYVAGVSGSCWSLAAYYTFGDADFDKVIEHCKKRFSPYHPLSGEAIRTILSAPGGARTTLGPLIQKSKSGLQTVAMDLYAVFTTGWIFFQNDPATHPGGHANKELAGYQKSWYRWSSAAKYTDTGAEPLPIMTAIRHERPWKDWKDKEQPFESDDPSSGDHAEAKEAWFQWYEMTPYEVGCDEIAAWVPTWSFGRPFTNGKSTMQLPEQSLALLLGLCTSAPAGPLTSYISTIARNLPSGFLGNGIHKMASKISKFWGKQGTEEFQEHHPLHACNEHNFLFHYTQVKEGEGRPPGLENSPRIHLIDSGMDNNCPTYVLLHPGREADIIINMDASSDVQKDTFQERVDQIGSRRGLKFVKRNPDLKPKEDPHDPHRFDGLYAQLYDGTPCDPPETVVDSYGRRVKTPPAPQHKKPCTMIYMPLLPNEKAVKDFDPSTAKFSGSYNLVWTAEQVETLVKVCVQNFKDGEGTVKEALHDAWMRKKEAREAGEREGGAGGVANGAAVPTGAVITVSPAANGSTAAASSAANGVAAPASTGNAVSSTTTGGGAAGTGIKAGNSSDAAFWAGGSEATASRALGEARMDGFGSQEPHMP